MSSLKSKTTPYLTKNPSLRWTDLEIQHIVAWLGYRDKFGELSNFDLYQTGIKSQPLRDYYMIQESRKQNLESPRKKLKTNWGL